MYVQSMEIDPTGRMWVIDAGSQNQVSGSLQVGPPRLYIFDVTVDPAELMLNYTFLSPVARSGGRMTFLNDIVVDWRRNWAYMTDTLYDGGIIAFDLKRQQARRMTNNFTLGEVEAETSTYCQGATFTFSPPAPSDGIALSPEADVLYWCPLIGHTLYAIDTKALRNFQLSDAELSAAVSIVGQKVGMSDGMAMTSDGVLYYGNLEGCQLNSWQTDLPFNSANQLVVYSNNTVLNWIDTFAFDAQRRLIFTSNRLAYFFNDQLDFSGASGPNFRILAAPLDVSSYMRHPSPSSSFSPSFPQFLSFFSIFFLSFIL